MRIINGKYKNRRFNIPKNLKIRPTTDKAKESLFNILENMMNFNEVKILDLFSGSGNISYEFFSRGSTVTCVDNNIKCIKFISEVCKNYGMDFSIIKKDVFNYLNNSKLKFDIIFADPPYNMPQSIYCKLIKRKNLKWQDTRIGQALSTRKEDKITLDQKSFQKFQEKLR